MIEETLKQIGLNDSEMKVYLALLKLGESKKAEIIKESQIAHSKIYINLDKLLKKGLVGKIKKQGTHYYFPSPVERIKDFLKQKEKEIKEQEKLIEDILPKLKHLQKDKNKNVKVEMFFGWKGLENVYSDILSKLKNNSQAYILGASSGFNEEQSKNFFHKYGIISRNKKIDLKIIFNENSRKYVSDMEKEAGIKYKKKFLRKTDNVEIAITESYTAIVMLKKEPVIILIEDKETSQGFINYFNQLWTLAKK